MGNSYETWQTHYDKQGRSSRRQQAGRKAYAQHLQAYLTGAEEPSGDEDEVPEDAAAGHAAMPLVPAGGADEAEAPAGLQGDESPSEPSFEEEAEKALLPVPGGSLARMLGSGARAEAAADAPARDRPSLLDAILANGGKLATRKDGHIAKPKPPKKANGRPAGVSAWKWLKANVAPFKEQDIRKVTGPGALKMLIAECLEQPDGKGSAPISNRVPYLQSVLLAARPRQAVLAITSG
jgi:hypothetical protein